MSVALGFDVVSGENPRTSAKPEPTVFVRTLSAPAGPPWDQARMATLEAQVGAPLPLADVVWRLYRLDPWRPGRPARYAACYVRASEAGQDFQSKVEVGGRTLAVHFQSAGERQRQALVLAAAAIVITIAAFLIGAAATSAVARREDISDKLSTVERLAKARLKAGQAQERLDLQTRFLDKEGVRHLGLRSVLADMAWASAAKTPDARIDAFHWDHGHIAVEARGAAPPFDPGDRKLVKDSKPLRPDVWLWGVETQSRQAAP